MEPGRPGHAPAKINLTLHITGQRPDGYHILDSLVVFAGLGDQIEATLSRDLTLAVSGPFAAGVPTDGRNLVLKAAEALRSARGVTLGAAIRLTKALPHAAGLGSGSSDAAATLALLAQLWNVAPLADDDPAVLALGADVPVCRHAPAPVRMRGIGEDLSAAPTLPPCGLVLVNPGVAVPTAEVFRTLPSRNNPPMADIPEGMDYAAFCGWLNTQRNDMLAPAAHIAPEIETALTQLRRHPLVGAAVMSGSGATCVALVPDMGAARRVSRAVQISHMGWWTAPAPLLT